MSKGSFRSFLFRLRRGRAHTKVEVRGGLSGLRYKPLGRSCWGTNYSGDPFQQNFRVRWENFKMLYEVDNSALSLSLEI